MKTLKLTCAILFSLIMLTACSQGSEDSETMLEYNVLLSEPLTSSEKDQAAEEQLINRLQDAINMLDGVSDTIITITTSEEKGKEVFASITTEANQPLTDEQKEGIVNIIAASCGDVEANSIYVTES
jgi:hypothetical protein